MANSDVGHSLSVVWHFADVDNVNFTASEDRLLANGYNELTLLDVISDSAGA